MKIPLCVALLCVGQFAAVAAESGAATAYTALRLIGKRDGEEALNRVVEVRGRYGAPAPETWKVTLSEATARGGLRELEVEHGKITSEKTPVARPVGAKINFNQLNLDSEGVFTVVNGEMEKASVSFDRADYLLKSSSAKGDPVWHVELFSGGTARVGEFDVAADSGTILRRNLEPKTLKGPIAADHDYVQATPPGAAPDPTIRRLPSSEDGYIPPPPGADDPRRSPPPGRYASRDDDDDEPPYDPTPFAEKVKRHFEKRGRQVESLVSKFENFFSGRGKSDQ